MCGTFYPSFNELIAFNYTSIIALYFLNEICYSRVKVGGVQFSILQLKISTLSILNNVLFGSVLSILLFGYML